MLSLIASALFKNMSGLSGTSSNRTKEILPPAYPNVEAHESLGGHEKLWKMGGNGGKWCQVGEHGGNRERWGIITRSGCKM